MPIRRSLPLALAAVLGASLTPSAFAQAPRPPQSVESARAQSQTVADMRNVGTALFSWVTDQLGDDDNPQTADPEAGKTCISWKQEKDGAQSETCESIEIDRLPVISYQELAKLLVPDYIKVLPEKDGWGNPFEFRLDRKHLLNKSVMAIRSTGSDGTFSGSRYKIGGFLPVESNQDLVWMDGFFMRWPERKPVKEPQ